MDNFILQSVALFLLDAGFKRNNTPTNKKAGTTQTEASLVQL